MVKPTIWSLPQMEFSDELVRRWMMWNVLYFSEVGHSKNPLAYDHFLVIFGTMWQYPNNRWLHQMIFPNDIPKWHSQMTFQNDIPKWHCHMIFPNDIPISSHIFLRIIYYIRVYIYTFWLFNIAMENGPFIDGLPIKNGDFPWLC